MSCQDVDVKAYALEEGTGAERRAVEAHLAGCADCRLELDQLGLTRMALQAWRDEEMPRRIAFVSDKVFEPTWWQRLVAGLNPMGMTASAVLAAVVAFGVGRAQAPVAVAPMAAMQNADVEKRVADEVAARVALAVKEAVAQSEQRQQIQTVKLVRETERRLNAEQQQTVAMLESNLMLLRKQQARYVRASADLGLGGRELAQ
jgi:anti-sigma factor RsiW